MKRSVNFYELLWTMFLYVLITDFGWLWFIFVFLTCPIWIAIADQGKAARRVKENDKIFEQILEDNED
jgi:hypothetical protein